MKSINSEELDQLKEHLIKKPFQYQEVFLEVLDHYSSAYEQTEEGIDETISRLDIEFTNQKVESINKQFIQDLTRKMRNAHLTVFTNYFRWPQLMISLLVIALFVLAAPVLQDSKPLKAGLLIIFGMTPMLAAIYAGIKSFLRRRSLPGKLKSGHYASMAIFIILLANYLQINTFYRVFSGNEESNILDISPYLTSGILLLGFVLCSTVLQVFWTKVKPNIA